MWDDITNFRKPRVGTQEMLKAFEQIVADEFKPMFNEAAKAIVYSKNNEYIKYAGILYLSNLFDPQPFTDIIPLSKSFFPIPMLFLCLNLSSALPRLILYIL